MAIKRYIESCMRGKDAGFFPHLLLYALSVPYGLAVRLRLFLYRAGVLKTKKLPCPVISVGNMTMGGTGKTPVTMLIAGLLSRRGMRVVILTRGYGRKAGGVTLVSDRENVLLGPEEAGDEPLLMATRLRGVPVVVGASRHRAGVFAISKFSPDAVILDDGFQHVGLHRDANILLVDSKEGFGNGYLAPRGVLREPVNGARRADIVMLKDDGAAGRAAFLDAALEGKRPPVFSFRYRAHGLVNLESGERAGLDMLRGKSVTAVTGIAGPGSFTSTLKELGARITGALAYPDHHSYTEKDLREIAAACPAGGLIVTTEKDGVKLMRLNLKGVPIYAVVINAHVDGAKGFEEALDRLIAGRG